MPLCSGFRKRVMRRVGVELLLFISKAQARPLAIGPAGSAQAAAVVRCFSQRHATHIACPAASFTVVCCVLYPSTTNLAAYSARAMLGFVLRGQGVNNQTTRLVIHDASEQSYAACRAPEQLCQATQARGSAMLVACRASQAPPSAAKSFGTQKDSSTTTS